jgi:hypothetical protein
MSNILDYVYYDLTSPSFLRWKQDKLDRCGRPTVIRKGAEAGYKSYQKSGMGGYWKIQFEGKVYAVHRLIFAMFYEDFNIMDKSKIVDHLDRNPFNNLITNLAIKTYRENCQNKSKHRNNSSGITGVYYDRSTNSWKASWHNEMGKQILKSFSSLKYGEKEAKILAIKTRREAIEKLNSSYNQNYTLTHGE